MSSDEKALRVDALRDLAHDCDTLSQDEALDYDYPGMRVQFGGTAQALRMAANEIDRLTAEHDRARSVAVALEQELARKDQALDEIRALHWKADGIGICELCGSWPCDTQRVLAALDAQLNKEDDQ